MGTHARVEGSDSPRSMSFRAEWARSAPREARHAVAAWLRALPCSDEISESVQLVVSELTTNAVVHTTSAPMVRASFTDGLLRIEVHDDDSSPPRIGALRREGGWGLRVVAAIADRWGCTPTARGKQVWVEIRC